MRGIFDFILIKYKNSSFQSKLFVSYFILIFIPLLVLSFISYNKSAQVITKQSMDITGLYLSQTEALVQAQLLKMSTTSMQISQNSYVHEVLENEEPRATFSDEFDEMDELFDDVDRISTLYDIYKIRIYISSDFKYSNNNDVTCNIDDLENVAWYKDMVKNYQSQVLLAPYAFHVPMEKDLSLISMVTLIRSNKDYTKIIGVVSIDMPVSELVGYLETANYTRDSNISIIDGENNILCSYGEYDGLSQDELKDQIAQALQGLKNKSGVFPTGSFFTGISNPIFGDWRIVSTSSVKKILEQNASLKKQLVIFAVLIGIVAYFLAYFYSQYNTSRIMLLAKQIKRVESGDFQVKCVVDSEDEIGNLQSSFNFMVRKINTLLKEQYNLGKNLKGMELKALQAQINPHFLYNTLDLISWKAKKIGSPEIVDIVIKLARFYQLSLSNGSDLIPLKSEFEHIRLYVDLQNIRFKKEIEFITEMDPEIEDTMIMKLLLQPIIENSIVHGILNGEDEQGKIIVTAHRCDNYIQIIIKDNGIGIEKSKLVGILSHERSNTYALGKGGFGLLNIIDRLKVYYSGDYTFDIVSTVSQGTTVTIQIPAQRGNDIITEF